MHNAFKSIFLASVISLFILSCKDHNHDDPTPSGSNSLTLEFDNVVGSSQLALDSSRTTYTNGSGEKFSVTQFNYFISNIRLKKGDGTEYVVPQDDSYFLVMESKPESQVITLPNVPTGDYTSVTFTIGVDSLRSTMDVSKRTGVLAPDYLAGHGMYWTWNSGYIFMKMEGFSAASPDSLGNAFYYHIGGFGGYTSATLNNIKTVTLSIPGTGATVRTDIKPEIHLMVDAMKIFDQAKAIKIADAPVVMFSPLSLDIANNYKGMFMVHHVHNDHE